MIALLSLVLVAALGSIGVALAGGRMDWLTDHQILAAFSFGLLGSLGVALLAALVLPFSVVGRGRVVAWLALLVVGVAPLATTVYLVGLENLRQPLLHDITTDIRNPPSFVFIAEARGARDNSVAYAGQRPAALQRLHFPDIQPLEVALPPDRAFAVVIDLLQSQGMQLAGVDSDDLRVEATWRSPGLRLHHDVVVRVSPAPQGSRIDARSMSRAGLADLGHNARLVREVLSAIRSRLGD